MKELSSYIDNVQEGFYQNADVSLLSTLNKCLFKPVLNDGENFYFTISNKGILSLNLEGLKVYFSRDGYHYYNPIKIDLFLLESQQLLEFVAKFGRNLRWYVNVTSKKPKPAADIVGIEIKLFNAGHYITHILYSGIDIIDYRISKEPSLNDWIKEGFYRNTNTHNYTLLKKAVDQLNELNTNWKHEEIPVKRGVEKILKSIEPIIGDFVIVQRCIKGYTSHYLYINPESSGPDKWWTVGVLYINTASDNSISIRRANIDTGSSSYKYIGNRVLCEIEAGLVEGFELGAIKNDKIEII